MAAAHFNRGVRAKGDLSPLNSAVALHRSFASELIVTVEGSVIADVRCVAVSPAVTLLDSTLVFGYIAVVHTPRVVLPPTASSTGSSSAGQERARDPPFHCGRRQLRVPPLRNLLSPSNASLDDAGLPADVPGNNAGR